MGCCQLPSPEMPFMASYSSLQLRPGCLKSYIIAKNFTSLSKFYQKYTTLLRKITKKQWKDGVLSLKIYIFYKLLTDGVGKDDGDGHQDGYGYQAYLEYLLYQLAALDCGKALLLEKAAAIFLMMMVMMMM